MEKQPKNLLLSSSAEILPVDRRQSNHDGQAPLGYPRGLGGSAPSEHEDTTNYWTALRRRWLILLLVALLVAGAGVLLGAFQTPTYQALIAIETQELNANYLNSKEIVPLAQSGADTPAEIQTQIRILQSQNLISDVLAELALQAKTFGSYTTEAPLFMRVLGHSRKGLESEMQPGAAAKRIRVRAVGQSRIVEILFDSTSSKLAADFLNTLGQKYIDDSTEARIQMTRRTSELLTRQIEDLRVQLERSENALQEYASATGLLFTVEKFTTEKTSVADDKLRQLQDTLSKAQTERIAKQSLFELTKSKSPESLPSVLDDTLLRSLEEKLTELRRQRAELVIVYTPQHAIVRRVEAQIIPLETAAQKERDAVVSRLQSEYEAALRRESLLETQYALQSKVMTVQNQQAVHYSMLKRQVDSNRQLYDSLLQRGKEAGIASALSYSNARILEPALPPLSPLFPNYPLNGAVGFVVGLFMAVASVVYREHSRHSLQRPGDATLWLDVPELGAIPAATARRNLLNGPRGGGSLSSGTSLIANQSPSLPDCIELAAYHHSLDIVADSFRATVASILHSREDGSRPRTIVLSSANPGEGKTTVTSNLAIILAEIGHRVVVVDGDLRQPSIHRVFALSNSCGLSDLLAESTLGDPAGCIHATFAERVWVLTSGTATGTATASLLYSPNLKELLRRLTSEFDTVLVDSPPMLDLPDARILGRLVDGVILVTRAERTTREEVIAARKRFSEDNIPVIGSVLNAWTPRSRDDRRRESYYSSKSRYADSVASDLSNGRSVQ